MMEKNWEAYLDENLDVTAEVEFIHDRLDDGVTEGEVEPESREELEQAESLRGDAARRLVGVAYGDRRIRRRNYTKEPSPEETHRPSYQDMTEIIMDNYRKLEDIVEAHIETDTEEFYGELESLVYKRLQRKLEQSGNDFASPL